MALIKCPECGKEISDKAESCINCGYPLLKMIEDSINLKNEPFPDLPSDLNIGSGDWNWFGDAVLNLKHVRTPNSPYKFNAGFHDLHRHKNGLCYGYTFNIHKSQIIDMYVLNEQIEVSKDGSVISGALVGGLLFGGVGAVLGGMSETNKKGKTEIFNSSFCIDFWDTKTMSKVTLQFVSYSPNKFNDFISSCKDRFNF